MKIFILPSLSLSTVASSFALPLHNPTKDIPILGSDTADFTHYKFWDFRAMSTVQNTTQIPLEHTPFNTAWEAQSWRREPTGDSSWPMVNSKANVFLTQHPDQPSSSILVLRTTRFSNYFSTAEIESRLGNYQHCSWRVRMRLMSQSTISENDSPSQDPGRAAERVPPGACAGMFIYRSATCESDLEILTSDSQRTIHYANQPDYDPVSDRMTPGFSRTVTDLPAPWTTWVTHRMDWAPGATRWYADDQLQTVIELGVPDRPSLVALNLWSDGGVWTGDMAVGQSVYLGIEWIELAYNLSTPGLDVPFVRYREEALPSKNIGERRGVPRIRAYKPDTKGSVS
ncbi:hypothetical protein AOCH_005535 [Aspergillus ochraceoroseus]|uniref:GH16 domain-containing protein n=1 Tax=Aspergillus ochraceoroseus TaxID=138278 RepID=A0A0F8WG63_9EURO|nr:hypothetical protein AOCH_005535 [Aspergillus ochraceoroseus]